MIRPYNAILEVWENYLGKIVILFPYMIMIAQSDFVNFRQNILLSYLQFSNWLTSKTPGKNIWKKLYGVENEILISGSNRYFWMVLQKMCYNFRHDGILAMDSLKADISALIFHSHIFFFKNIFPLHFPPRFFPIYHFLQPQQLVSFLYWHTTILTVFNCLLKASSFI